MNLADLWFAIIAILWAGFFVLEGFDFGVAALHRVVARSEAERRAAISTIGPVWDGNEVWLVVGVAAVFAAFPAWYATWLSAAYLVIILLLVALIARGVSMEWRGHGKGDRWRRWGSGGLVIGSVLAPFLLGLALGDLVAGLPVDADGTFTGNFWSLFTGFGLLTGVTMLVLCLLQGAVFLALRTTGDLRERAHRFAWIAGIVALGAVIGFAVWMAMISQPGFVAYGLSAFAVLGLIAVLVAVRAERDGLAFAASTVAMAATVLALFASLHPDVLVSSTSSANNLTVADASGDYALTVMTVVAAVFLPIVLLYQGYSYMVFRRRIQGPASASAPVDGQAPPVPAE